MTHRTPTVNPDQASGNSGTKGKDSAPIHFHARLRPYRSLNRAGFRWLMICVGAVLFFVSLYFFWLGAWPIIGFAGLDILLLYWAFRSNYASAKAHEEIIITSNSVNILHQTPDGEQFKHEFNPYWVRLESQWEEERGMTMLTLTSHGKRLEIGSFLHAPERESLAEALKSILADIKNPVAHVSGG